MIFSRFQIAFTYLACVLSCVQSNTDDSVEHSRTFPLYSPFNSNAGIAMAVEVPLQNGRGNVFVSFCFTMQLNMPNFANGPGQPFEPPLFTTIMEGRSDAKKRSIREGFLTRRKFYRGFKERLDQSGFNAHFCLLKAICETAQYDYGYRNGLLGDFIHVLFTPTSSKNENLPECYYDAEQNGHLGLCDSMYSQQCPVSIFDLITVLR